jgi:AcrR family transcriptional regulator
MARPNRKEEIFKTALSLMRVHGYRNTSMRDIAGALNMEAPSLYNHISSKEDLLWQTCTRIAGAFEKGIAEVNDIYFNAQEKLGMAIRSHIQVLTHDLDASYVFVHEWRHLQGDLRDALIVRRDRYEAAFREILAQGESEGVFVDSDNKFALLTILSSLNWVVEWYRPDGDMSPNQIANQLTEFILNGLNKHHNYVR